MEITTGKRFINYYVSFYGLGEVRVSARTEEEAILLALVKMNKMWIKRILNGDMENITEEDVCAVETE